MEEIHSPVQTQTVTGLMMAMVIYIVNVGTEVIVQETSGQVQVGYQKLEHVAQEIVLQRNFQRR
ncbi:hypothetical protein CSC82_23600 [Rhodobacteraceae bacterium 4F10]|nr:hypothetical protein CSC82_23600 [Rhodobacteraceae bacterium 4F10]